MYHVCLASGRNVLFLPEMAFLKKEDSISNMKEIFMCQFIAALLFVMIYNRYRMLQCR